MLNEGKAFRMAGVSFMQRRAEIRDLSERGKGDY
jgi:hypothetical protein